MNTTSAYPISSGERIREVIATFELENMPLSEQDIQDLRDIESSKTTTEAVRKRILKEIEKENKNSVS